MIIGNPPYVGSSKIDDESKDLLKNWSVTRTGKTDLYIPFFQIAIENLADNGIMGYITVNNFYRSVNGRTLRKYISQKSLPFKMIDFGSEQIFRGRSTYTCLCFIVNSNNGSLEYVKTSSDCLNNLSEDDFIILHYDNLNDHNGWLLQNATNSKNITTIENTGTPLGKLFSIKNGFATLKNDIYLFTPKAETETHYSFTKKGISYLVEKKICRDAIKPNTLKTESDINPHIEKLIFPYTINEKGECVIIGEETLIRLYPDAYRYLDFNQEELATRDKGNRDYTTWYAFGRTQALTINGSKLLFPYITDKPYFVLTEQTDLLFYNGYALVSDDINELMIIQKVLKSNLFWYYIKSTSKPYGSEYYALSKNYVKNFGVFNFNQKQKDFLLSTSDQEVIDNFLCTLYQINLNS